MPGCTAITSRRRRRARVARAPPPPTTILRCRRSSSPPRRHRRLPSRSRRPPRAPQRKTAASALKSSDAAATPPLPGRRARAALNERAACRLAGRRVAAPISTAARIVQVAVELAAAAAQTLVFRPATQHAGAIQHNTAFPHRLEGQRHFQAAASVARVCRAARCADCACACRLLADACRKSSSVKVAKFLIAKMQTNLESISRNRAAGAIERSFASRRPSVGTCKRSQAKFARLLAFRHVNVSFVHSSLACSALLTPIFCSNENAKPNFLIK